MWKKFNYDNFEEGLYWLAQMSPVFDGNIDQSGLVVGAPTGETKFTSILAWVKREIDGEPLFTPVDPANHGNLDENGTITHFSEVVCPADGTPVTKKALEHFITAFGHYNGIEKSEGNEQALQQLRLGIEILEGSKSDMVFVPGKSEAYNAGWESFFIDRELGDNPHLAGNKSHNDWSDGFRAALSSTNN